MNITIHFSVAVLFSLLVYFLGSLLLSIFKEDNNFKLLPGILIKYATGLLSLLIIYAVLVTCFKTIYSTALFAVLLYLLLTKQRFNTFKNIGESLKKTIKKDYKTLLFLQGVLAVFILFQYISTGYILGIEYNAINEDISYYVTLAEYLNYTGIENKNTFYNEYLSTPISGIAPYHYFDLYLSGFLFKTVAFLNNMEIYNFIFLPFCYFLISLSFISIFGYFLENKTLLIIFLGLLFTFFVGYFPASKIGLKGVEFLGGFGTAPFKSVPSYLALSLIWFFYTKRKIYLIALLTALLPTFSIIYLFHIPVIIILVLYMAVKNHGVKDFKPLFIPILSVFGIGVLYFFLGENTDWLLKKNETEITFLNSLNFSFAKTTILYGLFKMVAFFLPIYLIIIIPLKKQYYFLKEHFPLFFTFFLILFWGIIGNAFYQTNSESWQLQDIFFMPVMKIGLGILMAYSLQILLMKKSYSQKFLIFIPLVFVLTISFIFHYKNTKSNNYPYAFSKNFIENLKPHKQFFENKPAVVLNDTTGYGQSPMKAKPYLVTYSGLSKFISKRSSFISISVPPPRVLKHDYISGKIIDINMKSPMGRFYENNNIDSLTMKEAQVKFIKEHKINILLSSKKIPLQPQLRKLVSEEFYDKNTDQKIYILNH